MIVISSVSENKESYKIIGEMMGNIECQEL